MRASDRLKAARSDQTFRVGQQQPSRRFVSAGASPVAHMPNLSALSPLYPLPTSPRSAISSTTLDDAIGDLFTRYLPTYFDLLENFQYQKALQILEEEVDTKWKGWEAFKVMLKLGASCESTYYLMKYLEAELVQTDTIEQMYGKLVVLMNHLADELKPIIARQGRHCSVDSSTPSSDAENTNGSMDGSGTGGEGDENGYGMDHMLMTDIAMCGDMSYYIKLLEQGAEFFSLRSPMIRIYRGLALSTVPRDYQSMLKQIESLLLCFDTFNHPLLDTMKQSSIEELSTVHAAIQCEIRVAEYDFTRSIVALHRLKVQLRSWSDHIDAVSDYPLFEGNGTNGTGFDGEGVLLDKSDENYGITSDLVFSNVSQQSCPSHGRGHLHSPSLCNDPHNVVTDVSGGISPSLVESLPSYSSGRYANMGHSSCDVADEMAMVEKNQSGVSLNSSSSPALSETHSTFRRLLSHSNLLRRSAGLTSALPIRCGLVQKPGDPYIGSGGANSSMLTNSLEQAILGVGGNNAGAGTDRTSLGTSHGGSNAEGIAGGSTNPVAAEMMASSMKNQERDDGFALPVFQWSKRFYRSLVAKFTLYFHHWLEPFEKKTDYLALELSRFIKTPLGISYLQLMDVLLSRSSHHDESQLRVMLILETQALENKGVHYYENGYRCPSSSNALYTSTGHEKQDEQEEQAKHRITTSVGFADTPGISSRTPSPASSRGGGASPANGRRRSVDHYVNHSLFMRVDREENAEQSDFSELWGLRSWPAVFCYPEGSLPPLEHWPNIVSLIMDNRSSLDSVRPVFMHSERRQKTTYHISRVDDAIYLVLLAEGVKKFSEKVAQDFMQTVTESLQHSGAFTPRILVSNTSNSA
ncbi:unnamed protein product [Peronospora belbahrii]|uniref:RGS domain-containing protein n=1 Tax=Peronospora belbahrii TaxID=622444 RepID=A0ABN8D268_9STRA|nr:unnamed protein product [Peronospora belbahrii]